MSPVAAMRNVKHCIMSGEVTQVGTDKLFEVTHLCLLGCLIGSLSSHVDRETTQENHPRSEKLHLLIENLANQAHGVTAQWRDAECEPQIAEPCMLCTRQAAGGTLESVFLQINQSATILSVNEDESSFVAGVRRCETA